MKRFILSALLLVVLSAPVLAGDIGSVGITAPPPPPATAIIALLLSIFI